MVDERGPHRLHALSQVEAPSVHRVIGFEVRAWDSLAAADWPADSTHKNTVQHDEYYDPFVLLDHLGPLRVRPGEAPDSDDHPHRGAMTFTYAIQGTVHCHDYSGFDAEVEPGGVIWLAAGNGAVHSEKPTEKFFQGGGWVRIDHVTLST